MAREHDAGESARAAAGTLFRSGAHVVEINLDEKVILYRYNGDFHPEQAREIIDFSNNALTKHSGMYAVCDVAAMKQVPAATRKQLIDWFKQLRFPAIVCFGVSLPSRTAVTLITSAARLLGGTTPHYIFAQSEADAYVKIRQHRAANATKA